MADEPLHRLVGRRRREHQRGLAIYATEITADMRRQRFRESAGDSRLFQICERRQRAGELTCLREGLNNTIQKFWNVTIATDRVQHLRELNGGEPGVGRYLKPIEVGNAA